MAASTAAPSRARNSASVMRPAARSARARKSSGGRRRLPTTSARAVIMALSQPESRRRCNRAPPARRASGAPLTRQLAALLLRPGDDGDLRLARTALSSTGLGEAPQSTPPVLEYLDGLLTAYRREVVEKLV